MRIQTVTSAEDIQTVATLAGEIWREAFAGFVSAAQIDYMLERFLSPTAIAAQIMDTAHYQLVGLTNEWDGYVCLRASDEPGTMQLGHFDLRDAARGSGLATSVMENLFDTARAWHMQRMALHVNKRNARAVRFYAKLNFTVEAALVQDIGAGFVMDDYRMLRQLD